VVTVAFEEKVVTGCKGRRISARGANAKSNDAPCARGVRVGGDVDVAGLPSGDGHNRVSASVILDRERVDTDVADHRVLTHRCLIGGRHPQLSVVGGRHLHDAGG
jgi:hypothetical protein